MYEHQEALDVENLMQAAVILGLDKVKFNRDVAERVMPTGSAGHQSGIDSEVGGTPTLFINGVRNDDDDDFETLKAKIDEAITARQGIERKAAFLVMAKPVIWTVDDDPDVLRAVERDLRRQYWEPVSASWRPIPVRGRWNR